MSKGSVCAVIMHLGILNVRFKCRYYATFVTIIFKSGAVLECIGVKSKSRVIMDKTNIVVFKNDGFIKDCEKWYH